MGQKLPGNEMELYRRIDEVTHYMWDPIGIAGDPVGRDEYYAFLPEILKLAKREGAAPLIAAYLKRAEIEEIGCPSHPETCDRVAALIVGWAETLGCVGPTAAEERS